MKKCPHCAEDVQDAAVVCKHCHRDLSGAPRPVTVAGVDPFAPYHTHIQGKKTGKITVVGYLGIGLGVLMIAVAGLSLTQQAADGGQGAFMVALIGVGAIVGSYLWVRR